MFGASCRKPTDVLNNLGKHNEKLDASAAISLTVGLCLVEGLPESGSQQRLHVTRRASAVRWLAPRRTTCNLEVGLWTLAMDQQSRGRVLGFLLSVLREGGAAQVHAGGGSFSTMSLPIVA